MSYPDILGCPYEVSCMYQMDPSILDSVGGLHVSKKLRRVLILRIRYIGDCVMDLCQFQTIVFYEINESLRTRLWHKREPQNTEYVDGISKEDTLQ